MSKKGQRGDGMVPYLSYLTKMGGIPSEIVNRTVSYRIGS